jgi:hypothetical protein
MQKREGAPKARNNGKPRGKGWISRLVKADGLLRRVEEFSFYRAAVAAKSFGGVPHQNLLSNPKTAALSWEVSCCW